MKLWHTYTKINDLTTLDSTLLAMMSDIIDGLVLNPNNERLKGEKHAIECLMLNRGLLLKGDDK